MFCRDKIETDFADRVDSIRSKKNIAERVIVYCRTKDDICASFISIFTRVLVIGVTILLHGSTHLSTNRLFGMFHAQTTPHIKEHITQGQQEKFTTQYNFVELVSTM